MRVFDYRTGDLLKGKPTRDLVRASKKQRYGTGAVGAVLRRGWWHFVPEGQNPSRIVYVE